MRTLELPRLLAFDLDGTLLPASKQVSTYTRDVLDRMRALGCQVTVATGKFHHLALEYGQDLELDLPQISHDGAIVGGNGHDPVHRCMPIRAVRTIVERYERSSVHAFADDGADRMLLREPTEAFRLATRHWANDFDHVDGLSEHLAGDSAILTFYGADEVMQEIFEGATREHPELRITRYWSDYLRCRRVTFQPSGIDKGSGVLEVARQIGAEPGECMVFGDWLNDLPMFQIGAVSVAMKNAEPELHEMATYVTEHTNEQDGVAIFLEKHFL